MPNLFVAVGDDGFRAFSRDGKEWINRQTGRDGETYVSACFAAGRCVTVGRYGGENIFAATDSGSAWQTGKNDAQYANFVRSVIFFGGKYLALGGDAGAGNLFVWPSDDAVHWGERKPFTGKRMLRRFAQHDGLLVGVGDYGRRGASRDGYDWKDAKDFKPADTLIDVAYGAGVFVGGGLHGLRMRSVDGVEWTDRVTGEEGEHINAMIYDGKRFCGVGLGATYFSADGKSWDRVANENAPTTATFGDGAFIGYLWQGRILRSTDAVHWTEVALLPKHIECLAYGELKNA